jgi:hypothetical protein
LTRRAAYCAWRCGTATLSLCTHDLAALGQTLLDRGTALPISVDELRSLNPFAVEFRYDDEITSSMKREELDALLRAVLTWAGTEVDR